MNRMVLRHRIRRVAAGMLLLAAGFLLVGVNGQNSSTDRPLIGQVKPRNSSQTSDSPWGIQTGSLEREHLEKAAALGVKWTRLGASWREIEKEKGMYQWEETDRAFASALENNITPFVCLAVSNRLYCRESTRDNSRETEVYGSNPLPPTRDSLAFEAWLRFVRATVTRYKDRIRYWEVWNEPNHWAYWGAEPDGAEYGRLLRETAKIIKEVDPSAKVVGGALAGLDPEFTDKFLAAGTSHLIDIVTFHNYASLPEERIYKAMDVWGVINRHNPHLELWQGECGYPSHSSTRDFRGTSPWGLMIQAKWLLRQSFTDIFFCRTTLSNYFKLVHQGGRGQKPRRSFLTPLDSILGFPDRGGSRVKSVGVNEKCVLSSPDLTPKPAYYAYQNLCAVFDNRYKRIGVASRVIVTDPGGFYGIGEEDDAFPSIPLVSTFKSENGSCFIAYWLPWHPQEIIREARVDLEATDMSFKDPVLIDLLDGKVYSLGKAGEKNGGVRFEGVPLADYPFVIAERSELEILPQ